MTHRERLLAVFRGEPVDVLPWLADLTYWRSSQIRQGTLDPKYEDVEGMIQLHRDLGVCAYYVYGKSPYTVETDDSIEHETVEDGPVRINRVHTPVGSIEQRTKYLPESFCDAQTEHFVKRVEDLKVVRYVVERRRYTPAPEQYVEMDRMIGDDGLPLICLPRSPISAMMAEWAGVTHTVYLMMDAPDEFHKTLDALAESQVRALEIVAQSPAPLVHFGDNMSADNQAGLFDRYYKEHYRRTVGLLHEAGKWCVVHIDGTMRGLVDRMAEVGMDGMEALTPAPVGDIALADLRAEAGDARIILWGGLPGALFAPPWTSDDVADMTRQINRLFRDDGRFIVGSADQVPPDARIDDVRLVAEVLAEARRPV